jgi:hypothetical protein
MFVLNELERLLHSASNDQQIDHSKTKLHDIGRVDVNSLKLFDHVKLQDVDINKELSDYRDPIDLKPYISNSNYLTLDILFASLMKSLVLSKLAQMPERPYPAARLMICDHESYKLLLKFHYVLRKICSNQNSHRFFLNRPPFNVSAVMLLSDILALLDRTGRPFARIHQQYVSYDYSVIKQIFPYLKITDLVIVLGQIGDLRLQRFSLNASKTQQAIQFLTHFARSTQLIELLPIKTKLGEQHILFDNVSIIETPNFTELSIPVPPPRDQPARQANANEHFEPTLLQINFIAHRLQQLIDHLGWQLESVTFRMDDPSGFSKIFSQILHSMYKSDPGASTSRSSSRKNLSIVPVRVLVLDRFFDIQNLLKHTDYYGPFLDQESLFSVGDGLAGLRLNKTDRLDSLMYCVRLDDTLKTILGYSMENMSSYKRRAENAATGSQRSPLIGQANQSSAGTTQAIRRHLDIIKSVYESMKEGYLLLLKLEASLRKILDDVFCMDLETIETGQHDDIVERVGRVSSVLEQMATLESKSLTAIDKFRVALILIDTINVILFIIPPDSQASRMLSEIKMNIMARKEFNGTIELAFDERDMSKTKQQHHQQQQQNDGIKAGQKRTVNLSDTFERFDAISLKNCGYRSTFSLERIIEQFYERKLEPKWFPTLRRRSAMHGLVKNVSRNKIIVLVLGSITHDELTRMKLLETELMTRRGSAKSQAKSPIPDHISADIVIMSSGIIRPDELLRSLQ